MIKIENAKLIIREKTLTITCSGNPDCFQNVLNCACAILDGVEYIGDRIEADRLLVTLIKYNGQLYYLYDPSACGTENFQIYSMLFMQYEGSLECTNPVSDYQYVLDYYQIAVHDSMHVQLYFRSNEYEMAERMKNGLGKDVAFLKKI